MSDNKRCSCDVYELINCEPFEVKFDDESTDLDVELVDESNPIDIGIADIGSTIISNQAVVLRGTDEYWNSQRDLIAKKNVFYMYLNHMPYEGPNGETLYRPGLKIGDGLAYLIDTPFINGIELVITQSDIDRWNGKWRGYIDPEDSENLVFTTN